MKLLIVARTHEGGSGVTDQRLWASVLRMLDLGAVVG